ncbi:MAG: hypothetical protein K9M15_00360 [Candidatus Marinimicrobia bacterium]|nr:hypothetical protein [Candidatus Neomarinimicrobiota bacterium]
MPHFDTGPFTFGNDSSRIYYDGAEVTPEKAAKICVAKVMKAQITLAKALTRANDERNRFIEQFGDFDTFAEVWQHVGNNRELFDELSAKALDAREEADKNILDKRAFVEYLQTTGEKDLACRISKIFGIK